MAAENGMDFSEFIVEKGQEANEDEKSEETTEISLSPDLEAEEARKNELHLQATKVVLKRKWEFSRHGVKILQVTRHMSKVFAHLM